MVAGVSAQLEVSFRGKQVSTNDIGQPAMGFNIDEALQFNPGTATQGQANTLFMDKRSLTSGGTENLDVSGALTDAFGASIVNAEVVAIYLKADDANTVNVTFFGAASNPFNAGLTGTTPKIVLGPGEFVLLTSKAGWPVTPGTGDIILVAAGAAASSYEVAILGRTAAV
jgi:hypothetical protein